MNFIESDSPELNVAIGGWGEGVVFSYGTG
jgi:hypothetical protein